ncbi:MAG: hypothetical protein CMG08_00760 [Candidatus Marinimicrobia bacterium]|nr:hypothetical protein [Candidatus Neomarinimicrobiota bacterium]
MISLKYKELPQAIKLLHHLKTIDDSYDFDIIFPKKVWPNIESEQPNDAMEIIHQHHKVFQDSTKNDFGMDYIIGASTSADCWVNIKKNNDIIGYATNLFHKVNNKKVNHFRVTFFNSTLQGSGSYTLLQDLRINIFPSDFIFSRTQNPIVYETFEKLFYQNNMMISPRVGYIDNECLSIAKKLEFNVDNNSIIKNAVRGIVAVETPLPKEKIKSLWDQIDLYNGDVLLVSGYKKL